MLQLEIPNSRRQFLGSAGLSALMLPGLTSVSLGKGSQSNNRRAKSVIFLLLEGGMSHLDTWDIKANTPSEIRGEYQQIATTNPDLLISEHMPLLAKQAHRYNVVRSVHSSARNHSPGLHWILTGWDNPRAGVSGERANKPPSVGSIVAHELQNNNAPGLPKFVAVPNRSQLGGRTNFSGASWLGTAYDAFDSGAVPTKAGSKFKLPVGLTLPKEVGLGRLANRHDLLKSLDQLKRTRDKNSIVKTVSGYQDDAFDLLLGQRGQQAFDINQEPAEIRERYGNSEMGQGTLLARRLVEAGVSYVLVNYSKNNSWDTHRDNFGRLKKTLLPPMDRAVSALLTDLDERGMLDDTLVVLMGEMGRTPIINNLKRGRDHWPDVYSVMMAGGGLTRGQLLGSSDKGGGKPGTRPVHVHEILATVYQQLGIDPHTMLRNPQNRPIRILPDAEPVYELTRS